MVKVKFEEPLKFLSLIGLNPFRTHLKISPVVSTICISIFALTVFSSLLELCLNLNNFATIIRASEVIFPFYQLSWRLYVLIKHAKELRHLIKKSLKFWPLEQFGKSHEIENRRNHKLLEKFFLVYKSLIFFSCSQYMLLTIWSDKPMVLSYGETKGLSPKFRLLYFIHHNLHIFVSICLMLGFDGLFFYLVAHILSELKMVKIAFGNSKIKPWWNYKKRFRMAIEHHIFVLNYIRMVDRVYSMLFLNQHFSYLCGLCFGSYLLIENGIPPDYQHLLKYLPYILGYVFQVWMFSFAGDLIVHWSLEIPDQIFYDNWSLDRAYQNKLDKIFIIQRGQNPAKITLGGFRNLDLRSFTVVIKNALSFFTFINAVTK